MMWSEICDSCPGPSPDHCSVCDFSCECDRAFREEEVTRAR